MGAILMILLLALEFAFGTAIFGWWTVPLLAALYALLSRSPWAGLRSATGGILAWAGLLAWYRVRGYPVDLLAPRLAGAMQLPTWGLVMLTLLLPALLAGSAAALTSGLRGSRTPSGAP